jgi:hypothetical protein
MPREIVGQTRVSALSWIVSGWFTYRNTLVTSRQVINSPLFGQATSVSALSQGASVHEFPPWVERIDQEREEYVVRAVWYIGRLSGRATCDIERSYVPSILR